MLNIILQLCLIKILAFQLMLFEKEVTLYPTEGEYHVYNFNELLQQSGQGSLSQQMCKNSPQVPYAQVVNYYQEIHRIEGKSKLKIIIIEFKSISSNNTHFATLSKNNEVTVYEWKNQIIQQVGELVKIQSSYNCFSINLSSDFLILLDCYKGNQLYLMQIIDAQSKIVYNAQFNVPLSTKMQSIVNGTNTFLIYAQHFNKYSIISLLSTQFQNLSCWNNQFIDFDIPIKISPKIYILTSYKVLQISISINCTFQTQSNYKLAYPTSQGIIDVYYSYSTYSQCDSILVQQLNNQANNPDGIQLWGCENQIISQSQIDWEYYSMSLQNILQNNQFIIQQDMDGIIIYSQQGQNFYYELNMQSDSELYFNADNELFSFNQEIIVYKISHLSLQINLTNQEIAGNTSKFTIFCKQNTFQQYQSVKQIFKITLQVLFQNDTNIYVMFNQDYLQYNITLDNYLITNFYSFSGQLLNYKLNQDLSLLNSTQITFTNYLNINQTFQLAQILQINLNFYEVQYFFIGYNNQSLDIFNCNFTYFYQNTTRSCMKLNSITISINAQALKVASSIYPETIIIGISDNDTIYLFKQFYHNDNEYNQSSVKFGLEFSDFIVTYNNIIVLILNQEIQIMTLDFTNTFILNQEQIEDLFNVKIEFNPVQIIMNTQLSSSLLYINNVNEVIIISIDQNNLPIPISLIQVNFKIIQINLVNFNLILSYYCDNGQNICFQVWNVENLPKYYYEKSLKSLTFEKNVIIQSNNLFFFVTFSNYTVQVYNPSLPEHMSLYYILELKSLIQCSLAIQIQNSFLFSKSVLFYQNNFQILDQIQSFNISIQYYNQYFNNSKTYPEVIYNYSVSTALNQDTFQSTPNQSISIFSNFTLFQPEKSQTIQLTLNDINLSNKIFIYPINVIFDRQISQCQINQYLTRNRFCNLTQSVFKANESNNTENFILVTIINNQFFALQNNQYIQILSTDFNILSILNYTNLNFSECLKSTSNSYSLFSICQNITSAYWLTFQLNESGNNLGLLNIQKLKKTFVYILKINNILDLNFILGAEVGFQSDPNLYWFMQSQRLKILTTDCKDFSVAQLSNSNYFNQSKTIIVFYTTVDIICYQLIQYDGNNILKISEIFANNLLFYQKYINGNQDPQVVSIVYISILKTFYNNVVILISLNTFNLNNNEYQTYLSYIINAKIAPENFAPQSDNNFISIVLKTIPSYGNLLNIGNSIYCNGVLMQKFKSGNNYTVGIYYINNFTQENQNQPLLMQSSFNISSQQCAMIVNQTYINGMCLSSFWNNTKQNFTYTISTQNVTCHINRHTKQITLPIECSNLFSNGTYEITFSLPQLDYSSKGWIYALLSIIAILLLYFFLKVKYKTKNLGYIKSEIEL